MLIIPDISRWVDNPATPQEVDFVKMKAAGAPAVIFKASQALFTDLVFKASWPDAKAAGLLRGAYLYLDYTKSGLEQAKYFCDLLVTDKPELPPVVDFEERNGIGTRIPKAELWNALTYIEATTGRIPMIYTGWGYWIEFGSSDPAWLRYPLWVANWGVDSPKMFLPWKKWVLWQYTANGDGRKYGCESLSVDLNYFDGTIDQLKMFCGIVPTVNIETRLAALEKAAREHGWII